MRLLLIEDNAFMAYDTHRCVNLLGIFSITLYATVDEARQDPLRSGEPYDIALLRQGVDPQQDLIRIWQLHKELGVEHIFLTGIYDDALRNVLLRATTSLELPLHDILRLPLKQSALHFALQPYLTPECVAAVGHY
ncbi:hypothetical protein [Pseudomonas sp. M30-35]|uniref:hypothetical protein n=1 Tax=Pseudomonas sp. M30-35 TaxID=1981174 RepID=UPI000B3BFA5C|nr:hypothetical protein [Pseudomonas sp. M30-35]ARU88915.1 hypothetical protein B9K09_13480 [Pseudomonas sp. M30-35]